ncbi:MAG: transporter [Gammaproteobacteria bacterium]|nr:transporter [Gammaproteobacteria bacterium]
MKMILMNIVKPQTVLLGAMLAGSTLFNPSAQAVEKTEAKVEIPTTAEAIWQSIDKRTEELARVIETGKLDEVHHHAFAIRDLVAALPARSGALPADKLAKVKTNSQFVATLAERLDASGDAKDKAGTESNFQKLQKVLKSIRENYSSSTRL